MSSPRPKPATSRTDRSPRSSRPSSRSTEHPEVRSATDLLNTLAPRLRLSATADALRELGWTHAVEEDTPRDHDTVARELLRDELSLVLIESAAHALTTADIGASRVTAILHRAARQPSTVELAWTALATCWASLSRESRRVATGLTGLMPPDLVDRARASDRPSADIAALDLVADLGVLERLDVLVDALGHRNSLVGIHAAQSLAALTQAVARDCLDPRPWQLDAAHVDASRNHRDSATLKQTVSVPISMRVPGGIDPLELIARALANAVERTNEHRRPQPTHAACLLLDRTDGARAALAPLSAVVRSPDNPGHKALLSSLRRLARSLDRTDPLGQVVTQHAWRWLRTPATAGALIPILCGQPRSRASRTATADPLPVWIRDWHLVHHPARARALRALGRHRDAHRHTLTDRIVDGARTDHAIAAGAPLLLDLLAGIEGDSTRTADIRLTLPTTTARLAAVRNAPRNELVDWCFDPDPRVARHAAFRWSMGISNTGNPRAAEALDADDMTPDSSTTASSRLTHARVLQRLENATIAAVGHDEAGALSFEPSSPAYRLRWRLALAHDARTTIATLLKRLRHQDRRHNAIELVRVMELGGLIATELLRIAPDIGNDQTRTLASLAAVMGQSDRSDAADLLVTLTEHDDHRVRSNAIRALVACNPNRARDVLDRMLDDTAHRPRAEAVRCGLTARRVGLTSPNAEDIQGLELEAKSCDTLLAMLDDPRTAHRLAGVWAVGRVLRGRIDAQRAHDHRGQSPNNERPCNDSPVRSRSQATRPTPSQIEPKLRAFTSNANAGLAARIAEIAQADPEPTIRFRADRTARVLEQLTRNAWRRTSGEA